MRRAIPLLAVVSLAFAPVPPPKPPRADKRAAELIGEWEGPHLLVITKGRAAYHHGGDPRVYELRVDPSGKPPAYDMRGTGRVAGRVLRGIYRVEGDTLTLCYHSAGRERPAAFEGPGKGTYTATYRRKKR
jgi:uncharacterized protein (TIGR03067 family)